jgi:hypothetical protein
MEGNRKLNIIKLIVKLFLFSSTFIIIDMVLSIIFPTRLKLFNVSYIFIAIYLVIAITTFIGNFKPKKFFVYKIKRRWLLHIVLVIITVLILINTASLFIVGRDNMSYTPEYDYGISYLILLSLGYYILVLLEYFGIIIIIKYFPAAVNIQKFKINDENEMEIREALIVIRGILKVFIFFSSFFAIEMIYTILFSERYYLFKVNYVFVVIFLLSLIAISVITIYLNDLLVYQVKYKILSKIIWVIVLVLLVLNLIMYFKGIDSSIQSHSAYTKIYGKYDLGDQLMSVSVDYMFIVFEYIYLRYVVRYFPAVFNLKRK